MKKVELVSNDAFFILLLMLCFGDELCVAEAQAAMKRSGRSRSGEANMSSNEIQAQRAVKAGFDETTKLARKQGGAALQIIFSSDGVRSALNSYDSNT